MRNRIHQHLNRFTLHTVNRFRCWLVLPLKNAITSIESRPMVLYFFPQE